MIEPTSTSKGSDFVTLREFESWQKSQAEIAKLRQELVEEARQGLERLTDERFRALIQIINERQQAEQEALKLAREINNLHLAALNGEQARLLADRERFVNREAYEQQQKDFTSWRDTVNAALQLGAGKERGIGAFWGVMVASIGAAVGVGALLLAVLR